MTFVSARPSELVQLHIFCFSFLQDGDVRVSVFPEGEEVLVGAPGSAVVARENVGPAQSQVRQCADGLIPDDAGVIENLLKLIDGCGALLRCQIRQAAQVNRVKYESQGLKVPPEFIRCNREALCGLGAIAAPKQGGGMNCWQVVGLHNRVFRKAFS